MQGKRFFASSTRVVLGASVAACLLAQPALATETITYTYDVHGRLTNVARSGTVNNGVNASYSFDNADNRTNVTVTGSPNSTPPP